MSEAEKSPGGRAYLAKTIDELAAGNEQLCGVPSGSAVRMRLLRRGTKGADPVFAVSTIIAGEQATHTYYDEAEARARFDSLVDEIL